MSARRPFREVKLEWLQQLSCDKDLSDNARSVALYIVTTHMNGHTEKAWPSYQTVADATGKSVKTIQRAIREREDKEWLDVRRGNGIGDNTEIDPLRCRSYEHPKHVKIRTGLLPFARAKAVRSVQEGSQICPAKAVICAHRIQRNINV